MFKITLWKNNIIKYHIFPYNPYIPYGHIIQEQMIQIIAVIWYNNDHKRECLK